MIRIGILGCSNIARKALVPALGKSDEFELAACAARDPEKARASAEQWGCRAADYEGLLADPEIDAVYISLPVGLHFKWGKKALLASKHLLLEKTLTPSLEEAEELISLAKDKGLTLMEGLMYLYHPLMELVGQNLKRLGQLRFITASFGFPELPAHDIRNRKELGGGASLDNLIYPLSFSLQILSQAYPETEGSLLLNHGDFHLTVKKEYSSVYGVDFRGFLQWSYKELTASIVYGFGFGYRNEYTLWGSQGSLFGDRVFSRPPQFSNHLQIKTQTGSSEVPVPEADQFALMLKDFARKISGSGVSSWNQGNHILQRMELIDSIYRSEA